MLKGKEAEVDKFFFLWHIHIERGMHHAWGEMRDAYKTVV
jgi:hypothetical protein